MNYDGVSKNVTAVGFHEDGKWMYTGGEDCSARIWDLRQVFSFIVGEIKDCTNFSLACYSWLLFSTHGDMFSWRSYINTSDKVTQLSLKCG